MKIHKAYKFRLKTNERQSHVLCCFVGCARFVWNRFLVEQMCRLETGSFVERYERLSAQLTGLKNLSGFEFLKEAPAQVLQQKLQDLDRAFCDGFDKKKSNTKLPCKKKKGTRDSIRYPQGFKLEDSRVFLPKVGWLRFWNSRDVDGVVKSITVSCSGGKWFVSILTEQEIGDPVHPAKEIVGIDVGITRFATLSTGEYVKPLNSFKKHEVLLKKEQRCLSRKIRFSNNWKKQRQRIAGLNARIANVRKDFLHKVSTRIANENQVVVVEDLRVKNMSKSSSGTVEHPGKNVRAKSGLNKAILDQGWGEFRRQLEYKQHWLGGQVVAVDPRNTSRTCPECGHVSKENRKTQAKFCCVECDFRENADLVGAMNILAAGHAVLACGVGKCA